MQTEQTEEEKDRLEEIFSNSQKAIQQNETYAKFFAGVCRYDGTKNRGSFIEVLTTVEDTWNYITQVEWTRMTNEEIIAEQGSLSPDSECWKASMAGDMKGNIGGLPLKDIDKSLWNQIRVQDGPHGPSMVLPMGIESFPKTRELRMCISLKSNKFNPTGMDVFSTWFCGTLSLPNSAGISLENNFVKYLIV
mgnify:CR=1 FL=1